MCAQQSAVGSNLHNPDIEHPCLSTLLSDDAGLAASKMKLGAMSFANRGDGDGGGDGGGGGVQQGRNIGFLVISSLKLSKIRTTLSPAWYVCTEDGRGTNK
jgi:hypothetical protein